MTGRARALSGVIEAGPSAGRPSHLPLIRTEVLAHAVVAFLRQVHPDAVFGQVEVERGLKLVGVGHDLGFAYLVERFHQESGVAGGKAEGFRLQHGFAGDEIDERAVGAVPVDEEDFLETVVGNALGDVEAKGESETFAGYIDK